MSDNFEDLREREVLDIASKTNVISDGVKKVLVIGLDRRNLAAHHRESTSRSRRPTR